MKCTVVDSDGIIINMIQANPEVDLAPDGCTLYAVPPDVWTDIGLAWADRMQIVASDPVITDSTDRGDI